MERGLELGCLIAMRLTDDIRLPFYRLPSTVLANRSRLERSVSFEPRAGRVSPRQRCESASLGKNFFKKIFNSFSKRVLSMFQDSGIILSKKIFFSDFQTNLSPGIAMRSQRQKLLFACNQRRGTLPVRITWKGDWSSGVSLHCDARVPV